MRLAFATPWLLVSAAASAAVPFQGPSTAPSRPVPAPPAAASGVQQAPAFPPAQEHVITPGPHVGHGQVLFNFQNADIRAVVKAVSEMTGRNFLLDPQVHGDVTIISASPVSRAAAFQIFLTALKAQGFTAVPGPGGIMRILPQAEGNQSAPVSLERAPRGGDQLVTQVVKLKHSSAVEMMPLLRPLMAATGVLSVYAPGNMLVITDYADNVRRLLHIIGQVDRSGSAEIAVIPLRYASALDTAQLLVQLSEAGALRAGPGVMPVQGGGATPTTSVVPDLRTNSIIVRTDSVGQLGQIRSLIEKLDVPARNSGQTHVIYLRNASATKLSKILRGLLEGQAQAARATPVAASAGAAPGAGNTNVQPSLVEADAASNAIIITAPDAMYNNIRNVIAKLDVRRAQVFVQALIVEVTSNRAAQFGIQWGAIGAAGSGAVAALANYPLTGAGIVSTAISPTSLANQAGLSIGYVGKRITLPDGQSITGIGALARALEQDSQVNVLSTPDLLTLDNATAKIMVGQNVPFVTGSYAQGTAATATGVAVNPFETIERKDVGLSLKIKPQISQGDAIKLTIYEEVSSIAPATTGAVDIITNKRSLQTTVLVDNGRTIVLGGLIENNVQQSEQGIPILSRIPLLGALFKYRSRQKTKTNLMIFLKPTIVRAPSDGLSFTADRYRYIRGQEQRMRISPSIILPNYRAPVLPPLTQPVPEKPAALLGPKPAASTAPAGSP